MKKALICLSAALSAFFISPTSQAQDNVGIGTTTPDPGAILELLASDKGFLLPRIANASDTSSYPAMRVAGMMFYASDVGLMLYYDGSSWQTITTGEPNYWRNNSGDIYPITPGGVVIGATSTALSFQVVQNLASTLPTMGIENQNLSGDVSYGYRNSGSGESYTVGIDASDADKFKISNFSVLGTNDRVTIDAAGQVGIGNTIPAYPLDVTGDINSSGSFFLSGNEFISSNLSNTVKVGVSAGHGNSSNFGTFIGHQAGANTSGGISNTFVGYQAGLDNTTGSQNDFFGIRAGENNIDGSSNSFLGRSAGSANTSGDDNVFVGRDAGSTNTTGSQNTLVGRLADVTSSNLTNATAIGWNAQVGTSNSLVLGNNANVGIGISTPSANLHISGTGTRIFELESSNGWTILNLDKGSAISSSYLSFRTVNSEIWLLGDYSTGGNQDFRLVNWSNGGPSNYAIYVQNGGNNNVGLGKNVPQNRLHVNGNAQVDGLILRNLSSWTNTWTSAALYNPTPARGSSIYLLTADAGNTVLDGAQISLASGANPDIEFANREAGGIDFFVNGYSHAVTIDAQGEVGLGVSTPGNRLDVEGAMAVGAGYSGSFTAPADGAIIEGQLGVGVSSISSAYKFHAQAAAGSSQRYAVLGQCDYDGASPAYGLFSWMTGGGSGTHYGLYLNNSSATSATEYGIYSFGEDMNYFSNMVGIAEPSPLSDLHIIQGGTTIGGADGIRLEQGGTYWQTFHSGIHYSFVDDGVRVAYVAGTTGNYVQPSDATLKKNIEPIPSVLENVKKLKPVAYHYNQMDESDDKAIGFLAQEVEKVFPEIVKETEDGLKGLSYTDFAVISIKAIQEQQKQIEELKAEIEELKTK